MTTRQDTESFLQETIITQLKEMFEKKEWPAEKIVPWNSACASLDRRVKNWYVLVRIDGCQPASKETELDFNCVLEVTVNERKSGEVSQLIRDRLVDSMKASTLTDKMHKITSGKFVRDSADREYSDVPTHLMEFVFTVEEIWKMGSG